MQLIYATGHQVTVNPAGLVSPKGSAQIAINIETDHLSPDQARAQMEAAADILEQLVPLAAALGDGQVTPDEVVEAATQLRALSALSPTMRAALLVLVARLRMDLADGRISPMEAALSVLAVGRTAVGL